MPAKSRSTERAWCAARAFARPRWSCQLDYKSVADPVVQNSLVLEVPSSIVELDVELTALLRNSLHHDVNRARIVRKCGRVLGRQPDAHCRNGRRAPRRPKRNAEDERSWREKEILDSRAHDFLRERTRHGGELHAQNVRQPRSKRRDRTGHRIDRGGPRRGPRAGSLREPGLPSVLEQHRARRG